MIIACVLKTGGEYTTDHVYKLYDNILEVWDQRKAKGKYPRFFCLTDHDDDHLYFSTISLTENLPGWWSKLELFYPNQFPPGEKILYLDLDTKLLSSPHFFFEAEGFTMLRDFYHPKKKVGSGIMVFKPEHAKQVWSRYQQDNAAGIEFGRWGTPPYKRGDQDFMQKAVKDISFVQDRWPDKVVSYKVHCRKKNGTVQVPKGAAVICWHGKPRPWNTELY